MKMGVFKGDHIIGSQSGSKWVCNAAKFFQPPFEIILIFFKLIIQKIIGREILSYIKNNSFYTIVLGRS